MHTPGYPTTSTPVVLTVNAIICNWSSTTKEQLERHNEIKCSNWDATVTWKSLEPSMYESKEPAVP